MRKESEIRGGVQRFGKANKFITATTVTRGPGGNPWRVEFLLAMLLSPRMKPPVTPLNTDGESAAPLHTQALSVARPPLPSSSFFFSSVGSKLRWHGISGPYDADRPYARDMVGIGRDDLSSPIAGWASSSVSACLSLSGSYLLLLLLLLFPFTINLLLLSFLSQPYSLFSILFIPPPPLNRILRFHLFAFILTIGCILPSFSVLLLFFSDFPTRNLSLPPLTSTSFTDSGEICCFIGILTRIQAQKLRTHTLFSTERSTLQRVSVISAKLHIPQLLDCFLNSSSVITSVSSVWVPRFPSWVKAPHINITKMFVMSHRVHVWRSIVPEEMGKKGSSWFSSVKKAFRSSPKGLPGKKVTFNSTFSFHPKKIHIFLPWDHNQFF